MNRVLIALAIGTVLILSGCNQQEAAQVEDPQPAEDTAEATSSNPETTTATEEVASTEQEERGSSVTHLQTLPATGSPQEPVSSPAPVQDVVQPFDNNPQDTGVPCSQWTCRDEQGRSQAEIQHEWMMRQPVPGTNVPYGQAMTPKGQDLARQMAGTAPCTSVQCKRGY